MRHAMRKTVVQPVGAKWRCLNRFVRLLLTPTWKLRMRQQLNQAEMEYDAAINAYHEVQGDGQSGFYEHNQASYWKGQRDALRGFLPHHEDRHVAT